MDPVHRSYALALAVVAASCAGPASPSPGAPPSSVLGPQSSAGPKRIVAAIRDSAGQPLALDLRYGTQVTFVGNRLAHVKPGGDAVTAWNAHEWDLR